MTDERSTRRISGYTLPKKVAEQPLFPHVKVLSKNNKKNQFQILKGNALSKERLLKDIESHTRRAILKAIDHNTGMFSLEKHDRPAMLTDELLININTMASHVPASIREQFVLNVTLAVNQALQPPRPSTQSSPTQDISPSNIEWPSDKWINSKEKILGKKHGIITFLVRVWEPFIRSTGTIVTRDILAAHDEDAEHALSSYLDRLEMPKGLSILYPKHLLKIVSERPELARIVLTAIRNSDI